MLLDGLKGIAHKAQHTSSVFFQKSVTWRLLLINIGAHGTGTEAKVIVQMLYRRTLAFLNA